MKLDVLSQAVADSRDGITISDNRVADNPLVFVNPAFERLTGYALDENRNRNCRYLQNDDRDQPERAIIRAALDNGDYCLTTLRNYRRDGTLFYNELSISPVFDGSGAVTHFIGIQKDVTARALIDQQLRDRNVSLELMKHRLEQLAIKDGLTGIYNRRFFDVQYDIQWRIARRTQAPLALILIDIDYFKPFNDLYGHPAGDAALRAVADSLNRSFMRGSDFVARYGGEEFAILSAGINAAQAVQFSNLLCERVRALKIPHAASPTGYLTISVGYVVHRFGMHDQPGMLVVLADRALYAAKRLGRNQAVGGEDYSNITDLTTSVGRATHPVVG